MAVEGTVELQLTALRKFEKQRVVRFVKQRTRHVDIAKAE